VFRGAYRFEYVGSNRLKRSKRKMKVCISDLVPKPEGYKGCGSRWPGARRKVSLLAVEDRYRQFRGLGGFLMRNCFGDGQVKLSDEQNGDWLKGKPE
jgi:hypothetical protein